jgi:hypothetical protein
MRRGAVSAGEWRPVSARQAAMTEKIRSVDDKGHPASAHSRYAVSGEVVWNE